MTAKSVAMARQQTAAVLALTCGEAGCPTARRICNVRGPCDVHRARFRWMVVCRRARGLAGREAPCACWRMPASDQRVTTPPLPSPPQTPSALPLRPLSLPPGHSLGHCVRHSGLPEFLPSKHSEHAAGLDPAQPDHCRQLGGHWPAAHWALWGARPHHRVPAHPLVAERGLRARQPQPEAAGGGHGRHPRPLQCVVEHRWRRSHTVGPLLQRERAAQHHLQRLRAEPDQREWQRHSTHPGGQKCWRAAARCTRGGSCQIGRAHV